MKPWKLFCSGLILAAALAPAAMAQTAPAITPPAGAVAPAPPAALPPNIWDKICPRPDQKAACKAKICASPLGQLLNNMLLPLGALSGGLAGPFCPIVNAADLAKPADSAEGAAARLKQDEADAKARREAVRYMAGADCRYWPEVTDALIGALRADRNECVRMEAALALGRGCCCNRATMKALTLTVSGSSEDGNPGEDSCRVKEAALAALNHCLSCYTEVVPAPEAIKPIGEPIKEPIGEPKTEPKTPTPPIPMEVKTPAVLNQPASVTEFYHHPENLQEQKVVAEARRAAEHVVPTAAGSASATADRSVVGLIRNAMYVPEETVVPAAAVMEKPTTHGPVVPASLQAPKAATVEPPAQTPHGVAPANFVAPTGKTTTAPAAPVMPNATAAKLMPAPTASVMPNATAGKPMPAPTASVALNGATTKPMTAPPTQAALAGMTNPAVIVNTIGTLRESIYPEEREKSADALGACDGWSNPNVVQALVEAARSDAAPIVRAACLRSLTRMNARTLPVATVAQALKTDPDPRVRTAAEQALAKMSGPAAPAHAQ